MIATSPYADVPIPDLSLPDYVLEHAECYTDRPALIDGVSGRTMTYAELAEQVRRAAAGLAAHGFGPGDVLALVCPNIPEYAVMFLAALRLGGIVTPVNPLFKRGELRFQLRDSRASLLVTTPTALDTALAAAEQSAVREVIVVGEAPGATPLRALLAAGVEPPAMRIDPAATAALPYSSGTTGLPKGVRLTHRNLVANLAQLEAVEPITPDDVLIAVLPLFHIYGLTFVLNLGLRCGAAVVTMPRFDLGGFLRLIETHRVTRAPLVPPVVRALATSPLVEGADLSSLRTIISGAAPLSADVAEACARRLGCVVKQGYGLTETSPVTHINPENAVRRGTVGLPLPNTECRVVDATTGETLPPGQPGEVCVRGPQVMAGYLGQPEATADVLGADGWLRTGDVGVLDADGYLTLVDRLKEMIKVKGYQVAPAELEAILSAHPAVAAAAVVPSPDEEAGEVPVAYVVLEGQASAEELMAHVAEWVAPYKRLRRVEFVESIPTSASGKVLRRALVERERQAWGG